MNCEAASASLDAMCDGEMSSVGAQQLQEHLQACSACSAKYAELTDLRAALQAGNARIPSPVHLAQRVSDGLKESDAGHSVRLRIPPVLTFSLPTLLMGIVLGWLAMSYMGVRESGDDYLQSLVSSHVRSLMADHLMDIASSDSHTVKPWFHGRVDFSPPVYDLTREGYPLMGGRLEYLDGNASVALVYRHRKHIINLFIRPVAEPMANVQVTAHNGYQIIRWNNGSLDYSVVSDLNLAELENFRELLTAKR